VARVFTSDFLWNVLLNPVCSNFSAFKVKQDFTLAIEILKLNWTVKCYPSTGVVLQSTAWRILCW